MRGRLFGSILVASALIGGALGSEVSAAGPATPRETYIIVFKDGVNANTEANRLKGQGFQVRFTYQNLFPGVAVDLPPEAVAGFQRNPNVAIMEKDGVVTASDVQSTPPSWGLDRTDQRDLPLSSSYSFPSDAGQGVTAYIIDTGILTTHTEFTGRTAAGYSAIGSVSDTTDCNGHGTHVAGTVAGTTYGVAKKARVVPVRVLGCNGSGTWSGVIAGMDWVTANAVLPAVANLSLGGGASSTVDAALQKMIDKGVTVVVAAGNDSTDACLSSPARVPAAVTVGATTSSDTLAWFSNIGSCVDILAPGLDITSAWYTSTTAAVTISGTSMASPHVAGVAARLLSRNPTMSPAAVTTALTSSATQNKITSTLSGAPNLLLYVELPPAPVQITTSSLTTATQGIAYSATLQATGGDGSNYSWSTTGLPSGLSSSGSTISGNPTVCGLFQVRVTATSAAQSATTTLPLTVNPPSSPALPCTFPLVSPASGSTGVSRTPTLDWNPSANATSYQVCVTTTSSGCSATSTSWRNATTDSLLWSTQLKSRTRHFWHVRAINAQGRTLTNSGVWSFTTA